MSTPAIVRRVGRPAKPIRPIADYTPAEHTPTPASATTEQTVQVYHHHDIERLLWSAHDLAAALGISLRTAQRQMTDEVYGPLVCVGALRRVRRADVEAWIAKGGE